MLESWDWNRTFPASYLISTRNRTRLPWTKPPMRRTWIEIAGTHDPFWLFVRITHGFVHNGGGAINHRRYCWDYRFLAQSFPVLDTATTCGGTLGPVAQHPCVFELFGSFTFGRGEFVGDAWVLDFPTEYHLKSKRVLERHLEFLLWDVDTFYLQLQ